MIDLIKQLSELDNKRIENYMRAYVTPEYCGNEAYLRYWSKNKSKLYHALGNQLILKIPYEYTKSTEVIGDLASRQFYTSDFFITLKEYLYNRYTKDFEYNDNDSFEFLIACNFYAYNKQIEQAYSIDAFKTGKIIKPINMLPWKQGIKPLKIPAGTKPMRALRKIVEYLDGPQKELTECFEHYHQKFSQITNDKNIKGNLCFSIHPMDFLTLSDNNSGWKSCFSIRENGGYKCSTVEAMNSNNLICCYLENDNFNFSPPNKFHNSEDWEWNNKKWRVLITLTKDICMVGKAYPFQNEEISKDILKILRPIIAANIGWEYKYGPELYMDMKHINYQWQIENNQYWISVKATKKKNIIINTKGMYNDMLTPESHKIAWCLRNPVNRNKVISISGPCKCAECNAANVLAPYANWEEDPDDNSRYLGTNSLLCFDCRTASKITRFKS